MKIEFVISSLDGGGAERVLAIMANSLAKNIDNEISVITFYGGKEAYKLDENIKKVKLKNSKLIPTYTLRSLVNLIRYYNKKSHRPDVIVSLLTTTNFITIIVAKLFSIKIMAQEHISYLGSGKDSSWIVNITRKYLYRKADIITVLTSFDVDYYKKHGTEVYVMPNPCSFSPITDNSYKREKTILAVGSLNRYHHKGFDNLIKLIAPILKESPDWKLKIAGSGDEGLNYLTSLAKEKGILNQIVFTGFTDNVSELMRKSSIFILPSRYEGLPMVLLEAMSQGMACIAYNCKTGPSDIIENNKNGILVENQNMLEMQQGLCELLMKQELRNRLSSYGIKSLDKYNVSVITARYENMLKKIVGE